MRPYSPMRSPRISAFSNARSSCSPAASRWSLTLPIARRRVSSSRSVASATKYRPHAWWTVLLAHVSQVRCVADTRTSPLPLSNALSSPNNRSTKTSRSTLTGLPPISCTINAINEARLLTEAQPKMRVLGCDTATQLTYDCISGQRRDLPKRAKAGRRHSPLKGSVAGEGPMASRFPGIRP